MRRFPSGSANAGLDGKRIHAFATLTNGDINMSDHIDEGALCLKMLEDGHKFLSPYWQEKLTAIYKRLATMNRLEAGEMDAMQKDLEAILMNLEPQSR